MKVRFKSLLILSFFFVIGSHTYSQGPGNFTLINNTDCGYNVDLFYADGTTCDDNNCPGYVQSFTIGGGDAKVVSPGAGVPSNSHWVEVSVFSCGSIKPMMDGECTSPSPDPCQTCGTPTPNAQVYVTWNNCNEAEIHY